jgi:hypothetical protein
MGIMLKRVWAARAKMVDGSIHDLLLFGDAADAEAYIKTLAHCTGFDKLFVVPRRIIGDVERRAKKRATNVFMFALMAVACDNPLAPTPTPPVQQTEPLECVAVYEGYRAVLDCEEEYLD